MIQKLSTLSGMPSGTWVPRVVGGLSAFFFPLATHAATNDPLGDAGALDHTGEVEPTIVITDVIVNIVVYTALIAVIAVIAGGVFMIVGGETGIERGKKVLLYTIVGMLIILLAGALVTVFVNITS